MNPSQDSITSQLSQLQKKAEIAEQTVNHKNAEVQAAQRKLSSLEGEIKAETERLKTAQTNELRDAATAAESYIEPLKSEMAKLEKSIHGLTNRHLEAQKQLDDTLVELHEAEKALTTANMSVSDTNSKLLELQTSVNGLIEQKLQLERDISVATTDYQTYIEDNTELIKANNELREEQNALKATYATKKAELEKSLELVRSKLLAATQELNTINTSDDKTRQDLATRTQILDERDRNLRIRESKVAEGETRLMQNSNLMNL